MNFGFKKVLFTILFYASRYLQNCCPVSSGIIVRIQMEWNHCPLSRGMGVQIALEYSIKATLNSTAVTHKEFLLRTTW
ncbi:MAG: hypothetical protein U9R57_17260, partial [Thermodesulfobacteriota bacterium]|nr:hypothetical protein [Thermodesulfobacteriota bacterium]